MSPMRVEQVDEPKNCQANIRVHVASLCGHNELIPTKRGGTATIQCGLPDPEESRRVGAGVVGAGRKASDGGEDGEENGGDGRSEGVRREEL